MWWGGVRYSLGGGVVGSGVVCCAGVCVTFIECFVHFQAYVSRTYVVWCSVV